MNTATLPPTPPRCESCRVPSHDVGMLPGLDLALCYDCANAASEMLHDMTGVMEKDPPGGLAAVADLRRCIGKLEEHGLISKHGARAMVAFAESLALTAVSEDVTVD